MSSGNGTVERKMNTQGRSKRQRTGAQSSPASAAAGCAGAA
jgi:hypothetical protein